MYMHLRKTWMCQNRTLAPCELLRMSRQRQLRRMVCAGVAGDSESVIRLLCRVVRKPSMGDEKLKTGCLDRTWHDIQKVWATGTAISAWSGAKWGGRHGLITKASLLAGVGFALAMNWGQTGRSCHGFSSRTGFGSPLFGMTSHAELASAGFHLWARVCLPTHAHTIQKILFTESVVNVM